MSWFDVSTAQMPIFILFVSDEALFDDTFLCEYAKCIILTIAYSLKSVGIVTECINDHNDTNKCNNCLHLICMLNNWLINLSYQTSKE